MKYILGAMVAFFGLVGVSYATDCRQGVCNQNVVERVVVQHPQFVQRQRVVEFVEVPAVQFVEVAHHPQVRAVERVVVQQNVHRNVQEVRVEKQVNGRRGFFNRSRSVQKNIQVNR